MAAKEFRFGPTALVTTLTTNILNPPTLTGGTPAAAAPYDKTKIKLRHIKIVNKTGVAATFSLWIGAAITNAAGTEFWGTATSVPANSSVDWYGDMPLYSTDYLVGGAGTTTALTIQGEGTIEVA